MTDDDLAALLKLGHEIPGIECKGPGRCDESQLFAQITRAALGMSNRRDGGEVIIGVEDDKQSLRVSGLTPDQLETWTHDSIADGFKRYADPGISFTREVLSYESKKLVLLRIQQFDRTPVICTRNYQAQGSSKHVLRAGTLYIRDATKAATIGVATHAQLDAILELATEQRLRAFLATARAAGVDVVQAAAARDDAARFHAQRTPNVAAADITLSRGGWITVIRPARFEADRVELGLLLPLLRRVAVQLRGWDFPHIDPRTAPKIGLDHIEQVTEWQDHLEWWRFSQSGRLVDGVAFNSDWRDRSIRWQPPPAWKPGETLGVVDTVFRITEIFEVAARLAAALPGDDDIHVSIVGRGLQDRLLTVDDPNLSPFSEPMIASLPEIPYEVAYSRANIMSDPRSAAVKATAWFFERFGWNADGSTLTRIQETLRRRSGAT